MKAKLTSALPPASADRPPLKLPASVARMGVLPSVVYPDSWVNLHHAGSLFTLILEDGYLDVPANSTRFGRFENGGPYTHIALAGISTNWNQTDDEVFNFSQWEVKLRRTNDQYSVIQQWVPGCHLFGTAGYPNYFAMPIVIEAGQDLEIQVRNRTGKNMRIFPELRCRRKYREAVNEEA